jgi:hypothetical protein
MDCQSHHDTSAGFLNSTQTVEWEGPALPAHRHGELAARMDEEHVAAVGSSLWKFIQCRAEGDTVVCRGLGLVPVLTFGNPVTEAEPDSVRRTWTVTGGLLARRGDLYGSIRFEWRQEAIGGGRWRHRLRATVEGYPSRFLHTGKPAAASYLMRHVGGWYADYHRRVTCGFLRRLAQWAHAASEAE